MTPTDQAAILGRQPGETLRQARRRAWYERLTELVVQAETATRGHLTGRTWQPTSPFGWHGADPLHLFTADGRCAYRCASPELVDWWQQHGRLTFAVFEHQMIGSSATRRRAYRSEQSGRHTDRRRTREPQPLRRAA